MAISKLFFLLLILSDEHQNTITMVRSWLIKILLCFSHTHHSRRKQQQQTSSPYFMMRKPEKSQTVSARPFIYHIFSTPLKVSMLRKIRCRIRPRTFDTNLVTLPLSMSSSKQQPNTSLLNESQNCAETLHYECISSLTRCKQYPSLIAIDIGNNDYSQEQTSNKPMRQPTNFYSLINKSKPKNKIHLHSRSLIELVNTDSSLTVSSHRCQVYQNLLLSTSSIRKRNSDSIIFVRQHKHTSTRLHYRTAKQRSSSDYSSYNINSMADISPSLSDTTISTPNSPSDVFTPTDQKPGKTWRLKINDDLNKDGSRHTVIHKGSEESVRQRRQSKRANRTEEKARKIAERVTKANQRWQKYSNIDYELVFFISRYFDQLPLCSKCRDYFITYRTQFLAEDPRASLDYAAEAILRSSSNKSITLKQAAKARLIKDYDTQTDIIFNLCDTCLTNCEQIQNELKQINIARKMTNESFSPNIIMSPSDFQQPPMVSPLSSPKTFNGDDHLWSPLSLNQQNLSPVSPQNTITDLNQLYVNNLIQYHQWKLQQLYEQSQNIIFIQQYQNQPLTIDQQQFHYDLQSYIKQMQYHWLEILQLQYPTYSLSFPYIPSYYSQYLTYRHQELVDESIDTESSSLLSEKYNDDRRNKNIPNENDITVDDNRCYSKECDENQQSIDDRLTIETCHGLVEYCNTPLDDFIRGLQVLKCLSNFNCYSS